jgi:hypothetical protein
MKPFATNDVMGLTENTHTTVPATLSGEALRWTNAEEHPEVSLQDWVNSIRV